MEREDLPEVLRLEQCCFSDAWSEHILQDLPDSGIDWCRVLVLSGEAESAGQDGTGHDGTAAGRLAGYINVRVLGDEAELMRICIDPEFRGQGWSRPLLEKGLEDMVSHGAEQATLEVRAGNVPAVRLYERYGFRREGLRKNYYRDPAEDAAIYWNRRLRDTVCVRPAEERMN